MNSFYTALLALAFPVVAFAQRGPSVVSKRRPAGERISAVEAVELARSQTKKSIVKIVSLKGESGTPNPQGWSMIFHDPSSSTYFSSLEPGEAPEPAEHSYTDGFSPVFFDFSRVNLDNGAAFKVANISAADAKIGFDRVDYELRGREFTGEPIWTLRLINADDEIVGIVHLSAESSKVLRTVWVRHGANNEIKVIDSALSSGGTSAAAESAGASTEKDLKALPPVQNIEPLEAPVPPVPKQ